MYNNQYNTQYNTQSQGTPVVKPDFNDALDILNPNFTPTEKLTGLLSLPFNPILHPIKTVKGVFETYNKLASVPLAIYSGNIDKVKGILSGTEEFSGKDVLAQHSPTGEVHGFLANLEGFGLDIAADPFVGVVRLPEEAAHGITSLMHQSVAPGLPQVVQMTGASHWLRRFAGTGAGTEASRIVVERMKQGDYEGAEQSLAEHYASENIKADAKAQIQQLTGEVNKPVTSEYLSLPNGKEKDLIHTRRIYEYAKGNTLTSYPIGMAPEAKSIQEAVDTAELSDMARTQDQHRLAMEDIDEVKTNLNPEARAAKNVTTVPTNFTSIRLRRIKKEIVNAGGFENYAKLKPEMAKAYAQYLAEKASVGFDNIAATQEANPIRLLNNSYTMNGNSVIKLYEPSSIHPKTGSIHTHKAIDYMPHVGEADHANQLIEALKSPTGKLPAKAAQAAGKEITDFILDGFEDDGVKDLVGSGAGVVKNTVTFAPSAQEKVFYAGMSESSTHDLITRSLFKTVTEKGKTVYKYRTVNEFLEALGNNGVNPEQSIAIKSMLERYTNNKTLAFFSEEGEGARSESSEVFNHDLAEEVTEGIGDVDIKNLIDYLHGDATSDFVKAAKSSPVFNNTGIAAKNPIEDLVLNGHMVADTRLESRAKKGYGLGFMAAHDFIYPYRMSTAAQINMRFPADQMERILEQVADSRVISRLRAFEHEDSSVMSAAADLHISLEDFISKYTNRDKLESSKELTDSFRKFNDDLRTFSTTFKNNVSTFQTETGPRKVGTSAIAEDLTSIFRDADIYFSDTATKQTMQYMQQIAPNFTAKTGEFDNELKNLFDYKEFKKGDHIGLPWYENPSIREARKKAIWELAIKVAEPAQKARLEAMLKETAEKELDLGDYTPQFSFINGEVVDNTVFSEAITDPVVLDEVAKWGTTPEDKAIVYKDVSTMYAEGMKDLALTEKGQAELVETAKEDADAVINNLAAEQQQRFRAIRLNNFGAGYRSNTRFKSIYKQIDAFLDGKYPDAKIPMIKGKIIDHAVQSILGNGSEVISGDNFLHEFVNRNLTLWIDKSRHAEQASTMRSNVNKLNEAIGFDFVKPYFKKDNKALIGYKANAKALEGNQDRYDQVKSFFKENLGKNAHGYEQMEFAYNTKKVGLHSSLVPFSEQLQEAIKMSSYELHSQYKLAGLSKQISMDPEHFFPNAVKSFTGYDNGEDFVRFVDDANIQMSALLKKDNDLVGAFSSTASAKSIMGNPHTLKVNVKKTLEDGTVKSFKIGLFSKDPQTAFNRAFSTQFATHENLRLTQEIFLNDRYKLSNLKVVDLPQSAIGDTDILVPHYDSTGGLVKLKGYPPTPGNIAKFGKKGYLVNRTISAESRTLLNYNNLASSSPAYKWLMKNLIGPWKRGVLLNWAFPVGNAGDMEFKALSTIPTEKWPEYYQNLGKSAKIIQDHEKHTKAWVTLRTSQDVGRHVRDVTPWNFLTDIYKYLNTDGEKSAGWMTHTDKFSEKLRGALGNEAVKLEVQNALMYEYYLSLPVASTNEKATWLAEGIVKSKTKDEDFAKWIAKQEQSPVGRVLNTVTTDNEVAKRIHGFNDRLESAHRFASFATRTDLGAENMGEIFNNPEAVHHATEMIQWNDMHFAEMPGDQVLGNVIWPFLQFPVKNAIWWANIMAKKPWIAGQVQSFKDAMWSDDDEGSDSFWGKLGAIPASHGVLFRGLPGVGSMSTFALGVDDPVGLAGDRLAPILRPMLSQEQNKYKSWDLSDRTTHKDSTLAAILHGINPLEGNIQAGLNFIADPSLIGLAPSVLSKDQQDTQTTSTSQ